MVSYPARRCMVSSSLDFTGMLPAASPALVKSVDGLCALPSASEGFGIGSSIDAVDNMNKSDK